MRSLLDGHPNCFVFPHELAWQKNGFNWTDDLGQRGGAKDVFHYLFDRWVNGAIVNGIHRKYPFHFNRQTQKKLFLQMAEEYKPQHSRDWLDIYLTSFFNAWVDYQSLYGADKRFCVAFCPQNPKSIDVQEIEQFFTIYPDGYRVQVIRDPWSWWASEKKYGSETKRIQDYISSYLESLHVGMQAVEQFPQRYILMSFAAIIEDTKRVMRQLTDVMDLPFSSRMLEPTVNNIPTTSNSSFGPGKQGLDKSVVHRWRGHLNDGDLREIADEAQAQYELSLSKCLGASAL